MANPVKIALVQMTSGRTPADNIAFALDRIHEAAAGGARFVATPETTTLMELRRPFALANTHREAEEPAIAAFADAAKQYGIWLLIGSAPVKLAEDRLANRSLLYAPDGGIRARYDKIHMFDVDLENGESFRESKLYKPGEKAVLAETDFGAIGMTVCYDLRFPYLYRDLAKAGAHILTVPAAFTKQTGAAHWHVLLRARAIENSCYVIAPAQTGLHETGRETYGHSLVVDPWGEVIADAGTETGICFADIDMAKLSRVRERIPSLRHDRPFMSANR